MCPSGLVVFGAGCSLDAVPVRDGLNSTSTGTANAWDTWPTSLCGSRPYVVHVALLEPHALGGVLGQAPAPSGDQSPHLCPLGGQHL